MPRAALSALGAFTIFGLSPLYWKQLDGVGAWNVTAHRSVWCLLALSLWLGLQRRPWRQEGREASLAGLWRRHAIAAVLLTGNWALYIWATHHGHIIECSLGYFLGPLVSIAIGAAVLHERLNRRQWLAFLLAAGGVAVQMASLGRLPWIALGLAASFAVYGLIAKRSALKPLPALFLECSVMVPFALLWLSWPGHEGWDALVAGPAQTAWLVGAGLVTLAPLVLFGTATRGLALSTVGVLQFVTPTLQFLIGWQIYGETMPASRWASFALIWAGLVVYLIELRRRHHPRARG